jgi:AAA15 family ATPase/GTPase
VNRLIVEGLKNKLITSLSAPVYLYKTLGNMFNKSESEIQEEVSRFKRKIQKILPIVINNIIKQPHILLKAIKDGDLLTLYMLITDLNSIKLEKIEEMSQEELSIVEDEIRNFVGSFWEIYCSKKRLRKIPVILDFSRILSIYSIREIYDELAKRGKLKKHLEFLKQRIDYLEDIDRTKEDIYVKLSYVDKPLPLSTMGSGFISLLRLILLVSLADRGVIVMEEPEISLHPMFVDIFTEEIIKSSENSQFFISTHSIDFIECLLKNAKKHGKLKDILVVRLHRRNHKEIMPEVMGGNEAFEYLDVIGGDLRLT